MSRTAHKLLSASGGDTGYKIDQSLMFNAGDTAYLNRTPSSAGNRRTFTLSMWMKLTTTGFGAGPVFCCGTGTNDASTTYIAFYQGKWHYQGYNTNYRVTNRLFRDVGSWYHFVWAIDSTQGTADNRIRLYVNGVEETSFGTKNNPSQNYDFIINSTNEHQLGDEGNQTGGYTPFDGYMAEVNFIDGAQLTPSSFGETDSDTGQWIPKEPDGLTYGTNGFYLKFVSGAIGTDSSGEGNNYTANNLANADVLLDTPTNNFPTLNSLMGNAATGLTLSQGNLKAAQASLTSETAKAYSTMSFVSGKWYAEVSCSAANVTSGHGVVNFSQSSEGFDFDSSTNNVSVFTYGALIHKNGSQTQSGLNSTASGSNILGIALDLDNGTVQFYSNGSTSGNAETLTRNTGDIFVFCDAADSGGYASTSAYEWNYGQNGTHSGTKTAGGNTDGNGIGNFVNAVPSGFLAPCSSNLAAPTIKKSTDHFDIATYTGTGSTRSVTGLDHQPDILWIKARSTTDDHRVQDAVRGSTKQLDVNNTDAEYTAADGITSFNSDGFTIGADSGNQFNVSGTSSVAWSWKANGSGGANNSGDINATVSANTTAGISIVKWTANGSNADTIAHGLGVKPSVVWYKKIDNGGHGWYVLTDAIDGSQDYLAMNTTGAALSSAGAYGWATSSTISNWTWNNGHGMMAYAFAEVDGFSSFGGYIGDGTSDNGPFIYTGFKPRLVIVKKSSVAGSSWFMWDSLRHPENVIDLAVWADASNGDTSHAEYEIDFLSNGFKIRGQSAGSNASGATHFYMAFAEAPFKYATAR